MVEAMEKSKIKKAKPRKGNSESITRLFLQNLKRDKLALAGIIILVIFLVIGVFSESIAPYDPNVRHYNEAGKVRRLEPPSAEHWFGTTDLGRDIFSQVVLGTTTALIVGILASFLVTFIGSTLGIISGYFGGTVDAIIMRIVDLFYAIPFIPFVIVLSAVLQPSIWNVILAVSLLSWRTVTRLVRSQVLSIAQRPYIKAARVSGAGHGRIMFKYILPNVIPIILLEMAFNINAAIMAEASIAFLGFGDPKKQSWGQVLHINFITGNSRNAWWWVASPGIAIILLLVSVFFVARALEEVVDPRLRRR